jgi:hypothetical protein
MAGFTLQVRGVLSLEVVRELSVSRFRASAWPRLPGSWGTLNRSRARKGFKQTAREGKRDGRSDQLSAVKQRDEGQQKDLQVKTQRPLAYVVVVLLSAIQQRGRTA